MKEKCILVCAAMDSECGYIKKFLDLEEIGKNLFKKDNVVLVQTGYGKVNAAMGTQKGFDLFDVKEVINYGFVGSLSEKYRIGDYVLPQVTFQHDFDLTPLGAKEYEVLEQEESFFKVNENEKITDYFTTAKKSQFLLTGDRFLTEKIGDFDDAICDMEGYSVARVAYDYGVPVTLIKMVSDSCVKDGAEDFFATIENKREELQRHLSDYINSIK